MLYLAQVQRKGFLGKAGIRLLARQKSEDTWALVPGEDIIFLTEPSALTDGFLVLIELSPTRQIVKIQEAVPWILDLVQQYLSKGFSPAFLQQEAERVEHWRQSLTLQSQDLARRTIELEARREQIQELEEQLKQQKRTLELLAAQLQARGNSAS
ncbi:MAG: coiled-coil domain-containing protein 22 [Microcoleus vaginatus WJT46-NPBG5]|jgi:hypothetical protein|nr:coiled-coil domain-containing protein 22 [Microcoleus vaginatus WJT46-NPBG5]